MAYKDIVVHLGKDNRSAARLNAAIQLAQRHEGRVTGVYVLSRRNIPGSIRCEFPPQILKRLDTESAGSPKKPKSGSPNGRRGRQCATNGALWPAI